MPPPRSSSNPRTALADGEAPLGPEREFTVEARSQWKMVVRRFTRHKLAMSSLVVFILVTLLAFVGARIWKYDYKTVTPDASQAPSWEHPFGTDDLGHDYFAQVLRGAQKSIEIAFDRGARSPPSSAFSSGPSRATSAAGSTPV